MNYYTIKAEPAYLKGLQPLPALEHPDAEGHASADLLVIDAKVDIIFFVFNDWQWGQGPPRSSPMRRISENFPPHSPHLNSYMGINEPPIIKFILKYYIFTASSIIFYSMIDYSFTVHQTRPVHPPPPVPLLL